MRRGRWVWLLLLILVLLLFYPHPMVQTAYRAVRGAALRLPVAADRAWLFVEGDCFRLYYQPSDGLVAAGVLRDLEASWQDLAGTGLTVAAPERLVGWLYPTQVDLQQALGLIDQPTLGAYRLGKLHLLSPLAWLPELPVEAALETYRAQGPVLHELVHLALDYTVSGNAPLWFSEGLAQYWEWRQKGYVWEMTDLDWQQQVVAVRRLDGLFGTSQEYVAYRQSLDLLQFLYTEYGSEQVSQIMIELRAGYGFQPALERSTGSELAQLEEHWRASLERREAAGLQDILLAK